MSDKSKPTDQELRDAMNLICEYVQNNIPEGYRLVLEMSSEECTLDLEDEDLNNVEYYAEQCAIREAIDEAIEHRDSLSNKGEVSGDS